MLSMRTSCFSRVASSDASLWENLDDTEQVLAGLATPSLAIPAQRFTAFSNALATPSIAPNEEPLELQLFPSIEAEQKRAALTPVSSYINGAEMGNPFSQVDANCTQFLREEWLASAALTRNRQSNNVENASRSGESAEVSKYFAPSKATKKTVRQATSLLDQLDELVGSSPSPSKILTPSTLASGQEQASYASPLSPPKPASTPDQLRRLSKSHSPLPIVDIVDEEEPEWEIDSGVEAALLEVEEGSGPPMQSHKPTEREDMTAIDILNMSCSPPSQLMPHITLIKDMPEEQQQIYHRLAFNTSFARSSQTSARGVTSRGTRGKTWKATWQADDNDANNNGAAASSSKRQSLFGRKPRGRAKKWPPRRSNKGKTRRN